MIIFVLFVSLIARVWYTLQNTILFWDTAMYIGIGKFMYTKGAIGIFESFRPVLFPIILGGAWKIGLDPVVVGKIIAIVASLGLIYLCYLIGERARKNAGLYAAILIGFSPVILAFSNAPLTDIPSACLTVLAAYLFLKGKDFSAGLVVALAFLMRFPQVLIGVVFGLALLIQLVSKRMSFRDFTVACMRLGVGFLVLTIPYFIANIHLYGNALHPIITANTVVANSMHYTTQHYLYYAKGLFMQNPFIIFGFAALLIFFKKFKHEQEKARDLVIVSLLAVAVLGGYFSHAIHQELRYGISFLPYITILAGYGIALLTARINYKKAYIAIAFILMIGLSSISYYAYTNLAQKYVLTPAQVTYFSYFKDKGRLTLLTSSPQFVALSDAIVPEVMDTWEHAIQTYMLRRGGYDYIAFNECETICKNEGEECQVTKQAVLELIDKQEENVFNGDSPYCKLRIYKVRK
ncbi:MAG: glycosyltransferase family 39 protein [Patescibacteria group bacterium]